MKRLLSLVFPILALAYQISGQPQSFAFSAGPPSPIIIVSPQANAPFGANPFCYWVVANYPIGHSTPSAPGCISNANPVSTVTVNWNTVPGATSYDVLRTVNPFLPGGATNSAVVTAVTGPPATDTFAALSSYTVATAPTATATLLLDNQNQSAPQIRVTIIGASVNSFLLGAGGGGGGTPGGTNGQIQFNSSGAFGGFTMSGDATLNPLTGAITFTTVNSSPGSFGDATHVPQFAVNGKGLITSIANVAIAANATLVQTTYNAVSGAPTFTRSGNFQEFTFNLTGNVTSSTLTGLVANDILIFNVCQDATGSRTFSWPTGFTQAPIISATAGACTHVVGWWDGANFQVVSAVSTDTPFLISNASERAAPATPPAAFAVLWPDSTRHTWTALQNNSTNQHIMPRCAGTSDQCSFSDLLGTATNAQLQNPSVTVNQSTCTLGSTCAPYGGSNVFTSSHTIGASDIGKLVVMNCSSACTVTMEASPAATDWGGIESIGSTLATVSLNGRNYNGAASVPALISFDDLRWSSDGSNYFGNAPLVQGSGMTFSPASNGLTLSSTGSGGGGCGSTDQTVYCFRDDFVTNNLLPSQGVCTGEAAYGCTTAGSATLHGIAPVTNHPGILECSSSATNPSNCQISTNVDIQSAVLPAIPNLTGVAGWKFTCVFNLHQNTANQAFVCGLTNSGTSLPSNGIYIRFDNLNAGVGGPDTNFSLVCAQAGVYGPTSLGVAPSNAFHTAVISPGTNANTIKVVFDGTTTDNLCDASHIPTTTLNFVWAYNNGNTTAGNLADIDMWGMQLPLTR